MTERAKPTRPPRAPGWAWDLTEELLGMPGMRWMRRGGPYRIAATLGRNLGPEWTGLDVAEWIDAHRPGGGDSIAAPAAWLAAVLPSAGRTGPLRLARQADHDRQRAKLREHQAAGGVTGPGRPAVLPSAEYRAARAALRRPSGALRRPPAPVNVDHGQPCEWPEVRQPGTGRG